MVGLGTAIGIALSAALRRLPVALAVAAVVGAVIGLLVWGWPQAIGGAIGAACGVAGAMPLVVGTLRRGGTRGGDQRTDAEQGGRSAALAFVPILGYLEAVVVLVLGARLRRRAPQTHAGLRTLARD